MEENETEPLSIKLKKQITQKMSGSKFNLGHKRPRSVTPKRPVAIAPKTNLHRGVQNIELPLKNMAVKTEPGFIAIIPKNSQIICDNDQQLNKSIQKIDQYEILETLNPSSYNSKRIKLNSEDSNSSMSYIILKNQTVESCSTINRANDGEDHKITSNYNEQAQIIPIVTKTDKLISFNLQKNNSIESSINFLPILRNSETYTESDSIISKSTTFNTLDNSESLNNSATNLDSYENSNSGKSKSQKPVVIMQQLLSPPNRTGFIKTDRVSLQLNKLIPLAIQGTNIEQKMSPNNTSPSTSNESYYDSKTMNHNTNKSNNEEKDTDFLLKKEFPIISSSQVDSVLKAIDMQSPNKGILSNEVKKQTVGLSLPAIQGAAKLLKNETTQCVNIVTNPPTKLETNRTPKRPQAEKSAENYSKTIGQFVDTLQCYKCKECSYMSLNDKQIFEHIEREHINISEIKDRPVLKCMGCSNTFHHEASLFSHIVHDHQVHESEAQIMVQQLFYTPNFAADNNCVKPLSQIRIKKKQNEEILITRTEHPILQNNEQTQSICGLTVSKCVAVDTVQTVPQLQPKTDSIVENNAMHFMQNIDTVQNCNAAIDSDLGLVDVRTVPFFNNDDKSFTIKSDSQKNDQTKLFEIKNVNCSENVSLIELKNSNERNFEFVNFENGSQNEGEGYLREEDTTQGTIPNSGMEFVGFVATELTPEINDLDTRTVKMNKKRGRPKGSKSVAKPQPVILKQGYQCGVEDCGVRMLVQENIAYHQKCHIVTTVPKNVSFQCPECAEFKTSNWNNLAGHLWRSHIIDMELHSCDLCSYKTPSLSNLTNQHRGIHGDDRPFVCDNCGKGFKTTKQLRNHRDLHKAKAKEPLKCDECGRDFTNTRLLKLHKDSVHKESKPFTCSSCTYSASTRSALKLHLRRHTGEKPFACEQCSYSTGDHNSLRRHKLRHLGVKPYSCPHCSYACIQSSTYKVHLKNKHPGLDHHLMFSCQYCTYKSIKKENLLTHIAKHEQVSNKYLAGTGSQILLE